MKSVTHYFWVLLTIVVEVLTLLTVISAFVPVNTFSASLSIFVVSFPLLCVLTLLLLVKWIFSGNLSFSIISAIVLLLSFPQLMRAVSFAPNVPSKDGSDGLKVLSYNVKFFGFSDETCLKTLQYVNSIDADIVCLQEFGYYSWKKPDWAGIISAMSKYPYVHISSGSGNSNEKTIQKHVVTFSKFPIIKRTEIDLGSQYHKVLETDIVASKDTIRLFNCYLESNKLTSDEKQLYGESSLPNIFNKLADAAILRSKQADKIVERIGEEPQKTIVCGDFNDVPTSRTYNILRGDMNDAFLSLRRGLGITFHEGIYNFRIDYIFASKDLELLNFSLDKQDYSDHYPISATLRLSEKR